MACARDRYPSPNYPFSDELCAFMDAHAHFEASLKLANPTRFDFLRKIICSRTPDDHPRAKDQVIGFWYLDRENHAANERPFFKQDFMVNVDGQSARFLSYVDKETLSAAGRSPQVRMINDFFAQYGDGKRFYHRDGRKPWLHHFDDVADLPGELQEDGKRAKLANPLIKT